MSILEKRKDRKNSVKSNGVKSHVSVLVNFDLNNDVYELYFIRNDILYEYSNISTVDIVYPGIDGIYVTDPEYVCDIPLDVIYDKVLYLTTDSKDLNDAIINDKCDIVLNWKATLFSNNNKSLVSVLEIDEKIAVPHNIIAGVLKYSSDPAAAKKLIELIASGEGRAIFRKFGF